MQYSVRQGKGKVNVNCLEYRVGTNNMDLANFGENNAGVCRTKFENVEENNERQFSCHGSEPAT